MADCFFILNRQKRLLSVKEKEKQRFLPHTLITEKGKQKSNLPSPIEKKRVVLCI
jgi:hypothetical protein